MRPGDLVGVAALLEREPFKYELSASKDSKITLVTEECMESELKRLPLWLLALIRNLSAKTHLLKRAAIETRVRNSLKSLAEYLSHKPQDTEFNPARPRTTFMEYQTGLSPAIIRYFPLKALPSCTEAISDSLSAMF